MDWQSVLIFLMKQRSGKWLKTLRQTFEESVKESSGLIDAFTRATAEAEDRVFFSWMLDLGISFGIILHCVRMQKPGALWISYGQNSPGSNWVITYVKDCQNYRNGWRMER